MASPSLTTPPISRPYVADLHQEPVVVAYAVMPHDRPKSTCIRDTIDVGLLITFPCEPMARASSSVGIHYTGVFPLVAVVYGGGIACFGASTAVHHSWFGLSTGNALLAAWILNMMAPVASGACLAFVAAFTVFYSGDEGIHHVVSATSIALVAIFYCCQLLFLVLVAILRHQILQRSHASSCCSSCHGSCCFTLCCPCCSFAEAMQRARAAQDGEVHRVHVDELAAYVA